MNFVNKTYVCSLFILEILKTPKLDVPNASPFTPRFTMETMHSSHAKGDMIHNNNFATILQQQLLMKISLKYLKQMPFSTDNKLQCLTVQGATNRVSHQHAKNLTRS
jgi:hypothetical protein